MSGDFGSKDGSAGKIDEDERIWRSETFLRSIIENIPYMIFVKEAEELRFVRLNGAGEQLLGFSREELLGKNDYDFFPKEQADFFTANDRAVLEGKMLREIEEEPIDTKEHGRRFLQTKKIPIFDEAGVPRFLLGISEDVTERRKAQEALRESEERFRSAFDNAPIGFALVAADGTFIKVNQALCRIVGHEEPELTSRNLAEITHPDDAQICLDILSDLASGGKGSRRLNGRYVHGDGRDVWIQADFSPLHSPGGALRYVIAQIQDVSQEKMLLAELREATTRAEAAAKAKSEFLANMSHEIRTPMNGVVGLIDLLSETTITEQQRELIEMCRTSARWLLTIINEILDYSKIEAGKLEIQDISFETEQLLAAVEQIIRPNCQEKAQHFSVCCSPAVLPYLRGDPDRLRQVLVNLLTNAVKFTPDGGRVSLTLEVEASEGSRQVVAFHVQDNGIGIEKTRQSQIFQAFSQADSTITKQFGGTGLGLAICSELIRSMDGRIEVESSPGSGSTFSCYVPLREGRANEVDSSRAEEQGQFVFPRSLRILVVEDNMVNQKLLQKLLEGAGHQVVVAGDGKQGVETACSETFDVILMDIQMPVMSGIDAALAIRAWERERGIRTPIIALTAHALHGDREQFLEQGMDDYASKPIDRRHLFEIMTRLTGGGAEEDSE